MLVQFLFLGERLSFVTTAIWIAAFHLVWRPIRIPRRVFLIGGALIAVGVVYFYVVGAQKEATIAAHPEIRTELLSESVETLALPYLYATASIPVFSQLTDDPLAPRTYGQLTLLPLVKAVHKSLAHRRRAA